VLAICRDMLLPKPRLPPVTSDFHRCVLLKASDLIPALDVADGFLEYTKLSENCLILQNSDSALVGEDTEIKRCEAKREMIYERDGR